MAAPLTDAIPNSGSSNGPYNDIGEDGVIDESILDASRTPSTEEYEREIGDDEVVPDPSIPQGWSDQRKIHKSIFDEWSDVAVRDIGKVELEQAAQREQEGMQSLREIIKSQDAGQRIVGSPRDYQVELYERAKTQNTIAVLDTGSGKTLIAVLLLKHVLDEELERRERGLSKKISFFLVDKVTLVFQQHAVLTANIDHPIERLCGAMGCNLWSKELWKTEFDRNMVIVCTADVLLGCLMHSFVTMAQINLLIFDEAHHAKENHPYARIIKDFYISQSETDRPKVFGMTASPVDVDTIVDVRERALELETLLHARICTASDLKLLQSAVKRPKEIIAQHERLSPQFDSPFTLILKEKFGSSHDLDKLFAQAREISSKLGSWCSDKYWSFALSERQAKKYSARATERQSSSQRSADQVAKLDQDIGRLQEAQNFIGGHDYGTPTPRKPDVSAKVLRLHDYLVREFERSGDSRVLVFVERRHTAILLAEVFKHIGTEYLNSGYLVGSNSQAQDGMHSSFRDQAVTLMKFRKGAVNCLFATSVAEEGLDIQDCNVVIRFDPCVSMIQYIQSRGRARQTNSKFLHLLEDGDFVRASKLKEIKEGVMIMNSFCQQLPQDRLLDGWEEVTDDRIIKDRQGRTYQETPESAKLTYDFALIVLQHFVSCVPHDPDDDMTITYVISNRSGKFVCEVVLPEKCPIRSVTSKPCARKQLARCAAAFDACIYLRREQYLDDNFLPVYVKHLPEMRNARLGLSDKKPNTYDYIHKPAIWGKGRGEATDTFYLTVIRFEGDWDRPVDPIGLVTRHPLAGIPSFPAHRIDGGQSEVEIHCVHARLYLAEEEVRHLNGFTRKVWKDLFNKTFVDDPLAMSYWLAPLVCLESTLQIGMEPRKIIDWQTAADVSRTPLNTGQKWVPGMMADDILDRFLVDPFNGGRRFYTHRIEPSLKPLDPVPQGVAQPGKATNILDYSVTLWRRSKSKAIWNTEQPVVEATLVQHRLNILATAQPSEREATLRAYICVEPMYFSPIPVKVAAMCAAFPAIITRIESLLIAMEFYEKLDLSIPPALALQALTKDSDNQGEHGVEKINFQHGMGPNYERLEFIGDCFLKMATSIALFVVFGKDNEYEMHVHRMVMVCNQNLRNTAQREQYYRYVRGYQFSRRTWYPELQLLEGKAVGLKPGDPNYKIQLGDKTVADICEAAIGAAFVACFKGGYNDVAQFDSAVQAVGIFVSHEHFPMRRWQDFVQAYTLPSYQTDESNAATRDLARKLRLEHDHTFRYPRLAQSAFMHPSLPRKWRDGIPDYQRLEFLGDSLLDMATITHLYHNHPDKDPQWMTEHKMAMVCNKFLGALSVKMGFHKHVRYNSPAMESQIRGFVTEINELAEERDAQRSYWIIAKEPPKCLPDVVEAYVGAIFIDSGFNYAVVQKFFDDQIKWFFEDMSIYDTFASNHPINRLQVFLNEKMGCVNWRIMVKEVPTTDNLGTNAIAGVVVHETVVTDKAEAAIAAAVRNAKAKAASGALLKMEGLAPADFRNRYGCDCDKRANKQ